MRNYYVIFVIAFFSYTSAIAQSNSDKIIKKTDEIIDCHIVKMGKTTISYYLDERPELSLEIDKYKVKKIILANGKEIDIAKNEIEDKDNYGSDSKNAFKVDFFSPLYGYTEFVYERSIRPGQSAELAIGAIGWGKDFTGDDPSGFFVKLGYKFLKGPHFNVAKLKASHILDGGYIMPEFAYRNYAYDKNGGRADMTSYAFVIKFGKQTVFTDTFLIDWYIGGGYGYSDNNGDYSGHYGFITGSDSVPLSFTAGLRIGLLM